MGPHERRRIVAPRHEVPDATVGAIVFALAVGVPVDSDPITRVPLHGPHVLDRSDPSRLPDVMDPLLDLESGSRVRRRLPGRIAGVRGGLHLLLEKWN